MLAVILFHAEERYFPLGYLGVDIFFVISGFVVTPLILRIFDGPINIKRGTLFSLKYFYIKRFYRLAPALLAILIFSSILIFLLGPITDHQRFAKQGIATLFLYGNIGAYRYFGDYFSPNPNPLLHTWSLSVEEQIYIFLPILLMILQIKQRSIRKATVTVLSGIGVISIISFIFPNYLQPLYSIVGIRFASQFSFYSPVDRFWQFGAGGILFLATRQKILLKSKTANLISILSILILLTCLFSSISLNLIQSSITVTIFAICVITFKSLELLPTIWKRMLIWFGDRSYSFYLLHMPLIYLAKYSPFFDLGTKGNREVQSFIAILLTILIGNFSYSVIENRFRERKDGKKVYRINKFQAISSFVISLLIFTGVDTVAAKGIFRDPSAPISNEISPEDWDANCKFHQPTIPPRVQPCLYETKEAQKNFLLIGDSHAAHLSKTLIEIGKLNKANVYIFTYSACPFIVDSNVLEQKFSFPLFTEGCLNHNSQILKFLTEVRIDTIFYTQRSSIPYVIPQTISSRRNLNSKVRSGLRKLEQFDSNLIFIGITPEYSSNNLVLFSILGHSGKYLEVPGLENIFWKHELVSTKIRYMDVYSKFCDGLVNCRNKIGNTWLFVDDDHLSQAGGEQIKPEIINELRILK